MMLYDTPPLFSGYILLYKVKGESTTTWRYFMYDEEYFKDIKRNGRTVY